MRSYGRGAVLVWANSLEIKSVLFQEVSWIRIELLVGVLSVSPFVQPEPSFSPGSVQSLRCLSPTRVWSVHSEVMRRKAGVSLGEAPPAAHSRASWCLQTVQEVQVHTWRDGCGTISEMPALVPPRFVLLGALQEGEKHSTACLVAELPVTGGSCCSGSK